jgi:hypothetical protein
MERLTLKVTYEKNILNYTKFRMLDRVSIYT